MKIISINVGQIQPLLAPAVSQSRQVLSAIYKRSVSSLSNQQDHRVGAFGLEGDEQANLDVHGGIDKAVYAYPHEHYAFWQDWLSREGKLEQLQFGNFGENLTVVGLHEKDVYVGDHWKIANVLLEVGRFREPCFKFNIKMGWSGAAKAMIQTKTTGWYLKVLQPGVVKAGDSIEVIPGNRQLSILVQSSSFYSKSTQDDLWS